MKSILSLLLMVFVFSAAAQDKIYVKTQKQLHPGDTVRLHGTFQRSKASGQALEFIPNTGSLVSEVDYDVSVSEHKRISDLVSDPMPLLQSPYFQTHPLYSAEQSALGADLTRRHPHLRSCLPELRATLRLRGRLQSAMSSWFNQRDFCQVNPPIMTESDCEGAGEVFAVQEAEAVQASQRDSSAKSPPALGYLTVSSQLHLATFDRAIPRP